MSPSVEPAVEVEAAQSTTDLAELRTYLAAERTLFAVLRTGLAIAAGGSVIISLLGEAWPVWIQIPLAGAFLVVGYTLVLRGLGRYRRIARRVKRQSGQELEIVSGTEMTWLAMILQVAITLLVVLFILQAFE